MIVTGTLDICVSGDGIWRYVRIGRNLFDLIGTPGGFVFEFRRRNTDGPPLTKAQSRKEQFFLRQSIVFQMTVFRSGEPPRGFVTRDGF